MTAAITVFALLTIIGAGMIVPWAFGIKGTHIWRLAGWGMITCFGSFATTLALALAWRLA